MKKIDSHNFKHTLRDIHKQTENRKFCFVIGAGASLTSGIPTGGQLAEKWFMEIKERHPDKAFKKWINESAIDESDLATYYGPIYRKRFESDKTSGYEFLVQAMRSAKPSFGHIILAQILSKVPGHCVLTTNFDSLIETSIYQYTDKTPLVCGHESLSGYARPSGIHPLIVKIHRDLLLSPKSDPDEISQLDTGWNEPLNNIFSSHIPIIIGYGGNDGSLMSYFEKMNKPSNFFWCGMEQCPPSPRVEKLIEHMDGNFVTIKGFDALMRDLLWVFDEVKPPKEELDEITKSRIELLDHQLNLLDMKVDKVAATIDDYTSAKKEYSAFEYASLAKNEPDLKKRKEIYLEAVKKFPDTGWLWHELARFLHNQKNYNEDIGELETYYLIALSLIPDDSSLIGNYALYLSDIKKDNDNADIFYLKSLSISSNNSITNGNYANYLRAFKKDYDNAEKHYLKALAIDENNANFNGNYAQFLLLTDKKDSATPYLEKAFKLYKGKDSLLTEIWFYRYAHYPEWLEEAEKQIEQLLQEGIVSIGWDLSENVKTAIKNNHPNPEKLKEFENRITKQHK